MAVELARPGAVAHQCIHGYDGGHTLIASSIELDARSMATLLVMSDLAPAQARMPDDGYVTAYGLLDAKMYAIAKTWPAKEMPRPGCVWTHTIFLDFAAVSRLGTMASILGKHIRPQLSDFNRYSSPFALTDDELAVRSSALPVDCITSFQGLLQATYTSNRKIVARTPIGRQETLAVALWDQQWPSLRRRFRFSTSMVFAGTGDVPAFDVQLTDEFANDAVTLRDHQFVDLQQRHSNSKKKERAGWRVAAAWDARKGGTAIRQELRRYGADVSAGRRAFPLLTACALLRSDSQAADIEALFTALKRDIPENEGQLLRRSVATRALPVSDRLSEESTALLLRLAPTLGASPGQLQKLTRRCWSKNRAEFWTVFSTFEAGRVAQREMLSTLSLHELVNEIATTTEVSRVDIILQAHPTLPAEPQLWSSGADVAQVVMGAAAGAPEIRHAALVGVLRAGAVRYFEPLAKTATPTELLQTFVNFDTSESTSVTPAHARWLDFAVEPAAMASLLSGAAPIRRAVLIACARRISPLDVEPTGRDPWFDAWNGGRGNAEKSDAQYFAAFMLVRSLHMVSSERGLIFAATYPVIDAALESGTIKDDALGLLDKFSTSEPSFAESRKRRVGRAIIEATALSTLPVEQYLIESDWKDFRRFTRTLAYMDAGKDLLRKARTSLMNSKVRSEKITFMNELLGFRRDYGDW